MAREKGRYHDKEKYNRDWQNSKEIGIEADEGVNGKERKCMTGSSPGEQAQYTILEDEDHPDSSTAMSIAIVIRRKLCHTWR